MSRVPDERHTWVEDPDAERAVSDLRAQIARARAVVTEHRDQARAVGLAGNDNDASGEPSP